MKKRICETHSVTCPYVEKRVKCEVKECEECVVFTQFSRQPPEDRSKELEIRFMMADSKEVESEHDR